jgi:hypothetical protein
MSCRAQSIALQLEIARPNRVGLGDLLHALFDFPPQESEKVMGREADVSAFSSMLRKRSYDVSEEQPDFSGN